MPCKCNETVGNAANVTYREFTPRAESVIGDGLSLSPSSRQGQSDTACVACSHVRVASVKGVEAPQSGADQVVP